MSLNLEQHAQTITAIELAIILVWLLLHDFRNNSPAPIENTKIENKKTRGYENIMKHVEW